MNCGKVSCVPFLFILINMEEDRIFIGFGLISVIPVEDYGGVCEEVSLNRFALSTFAIDDSV